MDARESERVRLSEFRKQIERGDRIDATGKRERETRSGRHVPRNSVPHANRELTSRGLP
jgi:hypothetical protein